MPYNRIAIYGHRGWASSAISNALFTSGAPIRVLHRPDSDVSNLPKNISVIEVDVNDQSALRAALEGIDIVISLVGHEGITRQHALIEAIPHTGVKVFVPSDLGHGFDDRGLGLSVPMLRAKWEVENAAKKAGVDVTVVQPGCFAESALCAGLLGVDLSGNRIVFSGESRVNRLNICTRAYVAAAYASIFTTTPIAQIANHTFGISELQVTGADIVKALESRNGSPPTIFTHSLDEIESRLKGCLNEGSPLAAVWFYRWMWGSNQHIGAIGEEVWDVGGFRKRHLESLIQRGGDVEELKYKEIPEQALVALDGTFFRLPEV